MFEGKCFLKGRNMRVVWIKIDAPPFCFSFFPIIHSKKLIRIEERKSIPMLIGLSFERELIGGKKDRSRIFLLFDFPLIDRHGLRSGKDKILMKPIKKISPYPKGDSASKNEKNCKKFF